MSTDDDRRRERAAWPGTVHRDGRGTPPTLDDAAERIIAVFELSGWYDPDVPSRLRGPDAVGRVIRHGDAASTDDP